MEHLFKLGALPADPSLPRIKLAPHFSPDGPPPYQVDWHSKVRDLWGMYLNNAIGDCTCAEVAHQILSASTYGEGRPVRLSDEDVLVAYCDITGFDPYTGANDHGALIQDVLSYWRTVGFGGHKCVAFAEVNPDDMAEVKNAVSVFGSLDLGMQVPASAREQFAAGQPWDVGGDDRIVGGHSVELAGYDQSYLYVVTWGKVTRMTYRFWHEYVSESWAVIMPEWLDANGEDPQGVNLRTLESDLWELTGSREPRLAAHAENVSAGLREP